MINNDKTVRNSKSVCGFLFARLFCVRNSTLHDRYVMKSLLFGQRRSLYVSSHVDRKIANASLWLGSRVKAYY